MLRSALHAMPVIAVLSLTVLAGNVLLWRQQSGGGIGRGRGATFSTEEGGSGSGGGGKAMAREPEMEVGMGMGMKNEVAADSDNDDDDDDDDNNNEEDHDADGDGEGGGMDASARAEVAAACAELRARPVQNAGCARSARTGLCEAGPATLAGQFGQDYYLYTRHFARLRRRGTYVDVAANEAASLSNTWFLDACLGWRGVCVEPHPRYAAALRRLRSCRLRADCVSDDARGRRVSFLLFRGLSGVAATNKNLASHPAARGVHGMPPRARLTALNLTCTTLRAVLRAAALPAVDYLSLDVEGHELHVLRGIDWRRVRIAVISVEVTDASLPPIERFLRARGYVRHLPTLDARSRRTGLLGEDAIFLSNRVTWGRPQ